VGKNFREMCKEEYSATQTTIFGKDAIFGTQSVQFTFSSCVMKGSSSIYHKMDLDE